MGGGHSRIYKMFRMQVFLIDWLVNHTMKEDQHLGRYLAYYKEEKEEESVSRFYTQPRKRRNRLQSTSWTWLTRPREEQLPQKLKVLYLIYDTNCDLSWLIIRSHLQVSFYEIVFLLNFCITLNFVKTALLLLLFTVSMF